MPETLRLRSVGDADLLYEERCVSHECRGQHDIVLDRLYEEHWTPVPEDVDVKNLTRRGYVFERGNMRLVGNSIVVVVIELCNWCLY
jgi:hypothetical protein